MTTVPSSQSWDLSRRTLPRGYPVTAIGLPVTLLTRVVLTFLVASLFLEKYEAALYQNGTVPIPEPFFLLAIALVATKLFLDTAVRLAQPAPLTTYDGVLFALVCLLGILSLYPAVTLGFQGQTIRTFIHLVALFTSAFVMGRALDRDNLRFVLDAYFFGTVLVSCLAVAQAFDQNLVHFGLADALGMKSRFVGDFVRPISIMSEPAYLGYACLASIFIGIWRMHLRGYTRGTFAGIGACALTMLLTGAIGPFVVGGMLAAGILAYKRSIVLNGRMLAAGIIAVAMLVVLQVGDILIDRASSIASGDDASASARGSLNRGSFEIWHEMPFTGVGLGNSRFFLGDLVIIPGIERPTEFPAANVYLGLLGETGPFGVIGLVLAFLLLLGSKQRSDMLTTENLVRILVLSTALEFLIVGTFLLPPFWFWAGLRIAQGHCAGEEEVATNVR